MTREEAIKLIVERDVRRWGEGERAASRRLRERQCPTLGRALNTLAYYDVDHIDAELAAEAARLLTDDDRCELMAGG